jgi:hypothetical protein
MYHNKVKENYMGRTYSKHGEDDILIGVREGKRRLGKLRWRWKDNTKIFTVWIGFN